MTWKYWVIRKMNPSRAKNAIATEAAAAVNRGLRNRLMSIIGWAVARSATTRAPRTAAPAARTLRVAADAQPHPGAWMIPYTIRLIPAADSTRPRQSTGGVRGSREVGTRQATSSSTMAATGTKNRKTAPHQNRSSSQPPAIGPSAIPTPRSRNRAGPDRRQLAAGTVLVGCRLPVLRPGGGHGRAAGRLAGAHLPGPAHPAGRLARPGAVGGRDEPDRVRDHPGPRVGLGVRGDPQRPRRRRRRPRRPGGR